MTTTPIQIRFNDVDQMGHVNNAIIMEYFDLGKEDFFAQRGLPPEEGDFTVMIVHYDVDFQSQIHFHDHIAVTTRVERFGTKSLTVLQQVVNQDSGLPCATCRTVMSGYCRSTRSSAVIPDDVKARLSDAD